MDPQNGKDRFQLPSPASRQDVERKRQKSRHEKGKGREGKLQQARKKISKIYFPKQAGTNCGSIKSSAVALHIWPPRTDGR